MPVALALTAVPKYIWYGLGVLLIIIVGYFVGKKIVGDIRARSFEKRAAANPNSPEGFAQRIKALIVCVYGPCKFSVDESELYAIGYELRNHTTFADVEKAYNAGYGRHLVNDLQGSQLDSEQIETFMSIFK